MMTFIRSLLSFPIRSRRGLGRRRSTVALRVEACEPRRVMSAASVLHTAPHDGSAADVLASPRDHASGLTGSSLTGLVAFVREVAGDDELFLMKADGTNVTRITANPGFDRAPSWNAAGTELVFNSRRPPHADRPQIYRYVVASGETVRVTDGPVEDQRASWTPDGAQVIFQRGTFAAGFQLFSQNVTSGQLTQLTDTPGKINAAGSLSPDGSRLSFQSNRDAAGLFPFRTYVDQAGTVTSLAASVTSSHDGPRWSPDGRQLVFSAGGDLYVVDVATDAVTRITNDDFSNSSPAWSPDGSMLVFQSNRLDPDPDDDTDITTIHVISIASGEIVDLGEGRTPVWTAAADDHDHGHEGDVIGSVVDGRLVTTHRGYGYEFEPDTTVFDVGFTVTGLAEGTVLRLEILQGVTYWNGRGSTPRFAPVRRGVELNFNNDAQDVRIGATRSVGRLLDIGAAEATAGGTEVHDHFDVTVGRNWNGSTFRGRAPNGIYVVMGRLVGTGVNSSAPMAFVFNVGASETAHEAAVEFLDDGPAVSVFGVETPAQLVYTRGQILQVTYRFSDPVSVRGTPRLPLTIGGKERFATLDRSASTDENLVFSYRFRTDDRGRVRPTGNRLVIRVPAGSGIRGAAGGAVFRAFAVDWPTVQVASPSGDQLR
jgi:Tol biopolymer transport system component